MKQIICGLSTIMFCLIFATQTNAQSVYGESWLEYDDTTNTVRAVAYSAPDYNVDVYYCVEVMMTVYEGEEYLGGQGGMNVNESGWPTACAGIAQVELSFPYHSASDYFIETSHSVSNVQVPQQTSYYDPYGFYQLSNGDPVYFPVSFNFMGTGYPSGQDLASMLLGFTFSILHQGVTSSVPHHLQVLADTDVIRTDLCGQKQKLIQFRVVDQQNNPVGMVNIDEKPQPLTDTCNGNAVILSTCDDAPVSKYGNFTDVVRTGCPHTGPATCGFDFFDRWRWCRYNPYGPTDRINIAWMYYQATRTSISIDNQEDMEELSYKYP